MNIVVLLFSSGAWASPGLFSYQGRILNTQGQPLQSANVAFEFSITNPDGTCVIYKEQKNGVDMQNSNGLFDVPIGSGVRSFPAGPSGTLLDAFDNTVIHACNLGGTYTPVFDDIRRLRVKFYDGIGWSLISPDITIRSVPYAGFANTALNANKLSGKAVTDFVAKEAMPLATCSPTEVITFDGTKFVCVTDAGGAAGTITSVAGTAPIVVTGTTALTVSATVGTSANTLAAGNDSRFTDMRVPTDNSVTSAKIADATIQVGDLAPGSADGQVFRFQSGSWTHSKLRYTDLINGNNASPWPTATCVLGEYITWVSVLDGFACTAFSSSAVTTALGYTPADRAITIKAGTGLTGGTVDLSANINLEVDVGTTAGKIPQLDAGGKLPASILPATIADGVWEASGGNVYRSSGSVGIGTNSPEGQLEIRSANPQILISDSANSKGSNITGTLVIKDQYNVTVGDIGYFGSRDLFIRNADQGISFGTGGADGRMFISPTGRVGIGTISPSEQLEVVGRIKGTELCIGNICHSTWPSGGGGAGTVTSIIAGTGLAGGTITDNGTISIATGGVGTTQVADGAITPAKLETVAGLTATTYGSATAIPAITVDSKGRVTAATTHTLTGLLPATGGATGKFLKSDTPSWENILVGDVKNNTGVSVLTTTVCDANEAMSWSSVSNTFICQIIGSLDGSKITTGTIDVARLPTSVTANSWTADSGNVYRGTGNVGIGATAPAYPLVVRGAGGIIQNWQNAAGNEVLRINSDGSIGHNVTIENFLFAGAGIQNTAGPQGLNYPGGGVGIYANPSAYIIQGAWNSDTVIAPARNDVSNNGEVAIQAGGSERVRVKADGNVGIGTSTPASNLHVFVASSGQTFSGAPGLLVENNGTAHSSYVFQLATQMGKVFSVTNSGRVGIGTANPSALFQVYAGANAHFVADGGSATLTSQNSTSDVMTINTTGNADPLAIVKSSAPLFRVTNAGNVGVGTADPTFAAVPSPASRTLGITGTGTNASASAGTLFLVNNRPTATVNDVLGAVDFGSATNGTGASRRGARVMSRLEGSGGANGFGANLYLQTKRDNGAMADSMYISSDGKVGIGTIVPSDSLHIVDSSTNTAMTVGPSSEAGASATINLIGKNGGIPYYAKVFTSWTGDLSFQPASGGRHVFYDGTGTSIATISSAGNMGIGVAGNASEKLEVNGNVKATAFLYSSDRRLKEDVATYENALDKVLQMRGVTFKWKSNHQSDVGFIAQEVEAIDPNLVMTSPSEKGDGLKSVKYGNIVAIVVEAMKDLYSYVTNHEQRLKELEDKNNRLEMQNAQILEKLNSLEKRLPASQNAESK